MQDNPLSPSTVLDINASILSDLPDNIDALKLFALQVIKESNIKLQQIHDQSFNIGYEKGIEQGKQLGRIEYQQEMMEQDRLERHKTFGASSEKNALQRGLFDEADAVFESTTEADDIAPIPEAKPVQPSTSKPRGKRAPLSPELERVDVLHEIPEEQRHCPCGCTMVEIGEDITEQLDIIPMQVRVLRHIRKRYACTKGNSTPIIAELPPQPLPKTNASPNLLSMLLMLKYADGLPLHRIEHALSRHGATVPRQTLARWVIGASKVLQPLHNLVRDALLEQPYLHLDETVVQVLKEKGKSPTSQSYMWVQTAGPPEKRMVLYDYDASRSGSVPARLLEGYKGYLMTDGYEGYNLAVKANNLTHLVCWAHVRRKFVEAKRVQAKNKSATKADEMIALIGKLYAIEKEYKQHTIEERYQARQTHSAEVLKHIQTWIQTHSASVLPSSALGVAIQYLKKYWDKLQHYIERGDLPIDNNAVENAIRPFVVGRKAWLFSDTPAGAHASAIIYSMIETAKVNYINPYDWLLKVFHEAPKAKTVEDYEKLLPWNYYKEPITK